MSRGGKRRNRSGIRHRITGGYYGKGMYTPRVNLNRVTYYDNYIYPNYSPSYRSLYYVTDVPYYFNQYYAPAMSSLAPAEYVRNCRYLCAQRPYSEKCYNCRSVMYNL